MGFLVLENKLKDATLPTIRTLNDCQVRTIMATGDNTLTAISVGRNCGMLKENVDVFLGEVNEGAILWQLAKAGSGIDEDSTGETRDIQRISADGRQVPWENFNGEYGVALNGKTLAFLASHREDYEVVLQKVLLEASVYARMSPDDKATLVELLQEATGEQIGMCGDGANDCGALKQADAGISLSESEASIAAPFTSKVQDINCVITLLREGRAALTTTFQAFKFIELYSMIQFFSVTGLYAVGSNLSDN